MKTLYIDINNTPIANTPEMEVLSIDLKRDFYYSLGESVKGRVRGISSNIDLIAEYISSGEDATVINQAWEQVKEILFSDNPEEEITVLLPQSYVDWLRYNNNEAYRNLYEQLYKGTSCISAAIDVAEIYEEAVIGTLFRQIKKRIQANADIEELIFNDNCVSRKSRIVRKLKETFEDLIFVPFEKWEQEQPIEPVTPSSIGPDDKVKEDNRQIIAKCGPPYSFIDKNGDICIPESCNMIQNKYYHFDITEFCNFYGKRKACFHISSMGINELGNYSNARFLNEDLLAVQGEDSCWQILDKESHVIQMPYQMTNIYGINSLGFVLCEMVTRKWLRTSNKLCLVNIHSGETVELGINADDIQDVYMDPHFSLIIFNDVNNGCCYYDASTGIKKLINKDDGEISGNIKIVGNDVIVYGYGSNYIALDVSNSRRLTVFQYSVDMYGGFIYNGRDKHFLDIDNKSVIRGKFECSIGDEYYVKNIGKNDTKEYKLCRKGSNEIIENSFEFLLPIDSSKGKYAIIKYDKRLVLINFNNISKRKIITSNLPLILNVKEDFFVYSYNDSVINLCLLASNGKMYAYSVNYDGDIIAQSECGMNFITATNENNIHYLVDGSKIEVRNRNNNLLSSVQLPIECFVAVPCEDGYKLLTSDTLYRYIMNSNGGELRRIGNVNWTKALENVFEEILFVDFDVRWGKDTYNYYIDFDGLKDLCGNLLLSKRRISNSDNIYLMFDNKRNSNYYSAVNVILDDIYSVVHGSHY